ncbi:MAG TPA: hypothetical protein PLS94_08965 [Prolixibacteraceae bacterium]|nr:hypothetical protein [Prolixibacteraceae bacterium]
MELILLLILALGLLIALFVLIKANRRKPNEPKVEQVAAAPASDCCGAHEVCEYDLIKMDENRIEYYEDEELDAFKNIGEDAYTDKQIDQFREVLYTLKTDEIRYWLLSIERRNIQLPLPLRDEARMLMAEV